MKPGFLIVPLASVFLLCAQASLAVQGLDAAIRSGAGYLVRSTDEGGAFEYRVHMDPAVKLTPKYNMLRHAGSIYSMCQALQRRPSPELRAAVLRAGAWLKAQTVSPLSSEHSDVLAVWSRPEISRVEPLQAKLGGTGLGLVALLSLEGVEPGFTDIETLRGLGRFLVFMQREDGSFYSKYIPSQGGVQGDWVSLYYPGEAALGLLMLHEKDPSGEWGAAAVKVLTYLADSRRGQQKVPPDHWAMLATEKLFALEKSNLSVEIREKLTTHALQVCGALLQGRISDPAAAAYGALEPGARTTPTSTRLEGLLAARSFLPESHPITIWIDLTVPEAIGFLLRAQVSGGPFDGAVPRGTILLDPSAKDAENANARRREVRIDYIQHALSALIAYEQYLDR